MSIVKTKPTSPGRRGVVKVVHPELYKGRPLASLVEKKSKSAATVVAGVVCPVVNTGVFLIGCSLFFMEKILLCKMLNTLKTMKKIALKLTKYFLSGKFCLTNLLKLLLDFLPHCYNFVYVF